MSVASACARRNKLNLKDSRKAALTIYYRGRLGHEILSLFPLTNLSMLLVFQRFEIFTTCSSHDQATFSSAEKDTPVARSFGARSFCLL